VRAQDGDLVHELESFVPDVMGSTGTPGLNVAVARHGDVIWEAAYGLADIAKAAPMSTETASPVASITKMYTAAAVLQLVEAGVLGLDEPVERRLEDVPVRNPIGGRAVTARNLMTHRSGLATDTPTGDLSAPPPLTELLRRTVGADRRAQYRDGEPCWTAPVGERFQYSNLGICLLGLLVERLNPEGLPFADYVSTHLLEPLGMRRTAVGETGAPVSTGYARFRQILVPSPRIETATAPADGLVTTPGDHVRLLTAMLDGGRGVLSPSAVRDMVRPCVRQLDVAVEEGAWYGLGTEVGNVGRRDQYFGHSGAYPFGWWSDSRAYPELDCAVMVSTNKWDLLRWYNPGATIAPGLIAGFVARRLMDSRRPPRRSWAWKSSYVAGMLLAERVNGVVGAPTHLRPELLSVDAPDRPGWDRAGFEAGARDLLAERLTPAGIRDFLGSDRLGVPATELDALALALGGRAPLPLPMPYWSAERPNDTSARSQTAAS
jgi:CubicO group peptidase (beta-lactamase class C family)